MPELKNIDVDFLSVVDAGANGKPVLLAKSEATTTERGENKSMGKKNMQPQEEPFAKSNDDVKGFLNVVNILKSVPGIGALMGQQPERVAIQKGAVKDKFDNSKKSSDFWNAWYAFESTIRRYNWSTDRYEFESDMETAREAIQDFVDILQEILLTEDIAKALGKPPEKIAKAGKKISSANQEKINSAITHLQEVIADVEGEEEIVKAEEIAEAVAAAVEPFSKQVQDLTKQVAELQKSEEVANVSTIEATPEDTGAAETNAVTEAVLKALEPFQQQMQSLAADVQVLKNTRGGSTQPPVEEKIEKSENDTSFAGLL
ncbi:hypothetical protein [Aneurinibacillus migulanus]|uniref:hypothetical protein n=1 Tax=Aneurinibacillus migulanus TaxID=47500 RepID=UPI00209FB3DC|nr:hypothetical protein [Aneurinibacillus migulanus]MCP1358754.1 hypothetical protein [Aneurinibacillus migulanus]